MQKLMRLVSKPVAFILLLSFSFNASGQSISAKMEKDFRIDARIKVSQAAKVLNTAVDAYEKAGPKAFADSFGSLLNPEEKTFVIKELKGLPPFPRLKMEGDKLVVFYKKEIIAQLESYDVAQGIFEGGPFHYTFDNNLGLIENLQNWKSLDKGSAQNEQHSRFLMNLFIPQAEAIVTTKWAIPIIGAVLVLGVLIGNWFGKPSNSTKVADANAAKTVEPPPSSTPGQPSHAGQVGSTAAGDEHGKAPSKTEKTVSSRSTTNSTNKRVEAAITDCGKNIGCLEDLKNKHKSSEDTKKIQARIANLESDPITTSTGAETGTPVSSQTSSVTETTELPPSTPTTDTNSKTLPEKQDGIIRLLPPPPPRIPNFPRF